MSNTFLVKLWAAYEENIHIDSFSMAKKLSLLRDFHDERLFHANNNRKVGVVSIQTITAQKRSESDNSLKRVSLRDNRKVQTYEDRIILVNDNFSIIIKPKL